MPVSDNRYYLQKDAFNYEKINELLKEMPQFAADYFRAKRNENFSSNTLLAYAYDMRFFFQYLSESAGFKNKDLKTATPDILDLITPQDIDEYLDYTLRYQDKNTGRTVTNDSNSRKRKVSSLRSFYSYYFTMDMIKTNPAVKVNIPKEKEKEIITFDEEEIEKILSAVRKEETQSLRKKLAKDKIRSRDYAIITTLFGTGLRVSELVGLNVGNVDIKNGCLHVLRKGGKEASVYFGQSVENAITAYWGADRNDLHPSDDDPDALFISLQHKRMGVRAIEIMIQKYAEEAGVKAIHPHACRASYGTHVYRDTGDIYMVADALGHASVETTKRHYAKIDETRRRIAAKSADHLFYHE